MQNNFETIFNQILGQYPDDMRPIMEEIIESDKGFDDYMQSIHAEDYHGCDDDMPDAYSEWLYDTLDCSDRLDYYLLYLS